MFYGLKFWFEVMQVFLFFLLFLLFLCLFGLDKCSSIVLIMDNTALC